MAGTQSESSGNNQNEDVPAKKKRLTLSFKAFRQLFSRRKRTKSKEEEGRNMKAKSTTDMVSHISDDDDSSQLSTNKNLSLSHDSVFNSEKPKPRDANIEDLREATRSMEVLPQSMFTSELTQAVRGRRGPDDEDEDEALPASPVTHITTTADVLQNGLKAPRDPTISQGSDQSLLSMGDSSGEELEEEFFESNWANKSGSKHNLASDQSSDNDTLDLDCIKSSGSLNMMPMKSKIDVRPRNVRPSSKHHRPAGAAPATGGTTRTTSPKPPPGAVQVLPMLKEPVEEEDEEEEAPEPEEPQPTEEEKKEENTDFRRVVLRKTSQKDVIVTKEKDVSSESKGVVLRSSAVKQDPSKRSTVAVSNTSELTAFGERKIKRSSLVDTKNWEDGKEGESKGSNVSEFAQAFHKFQKKTPVKSNETKKEGDQVDENPKKEKEEVKQVVTSPKKDLQAPVPGLKSESKKDIKKEVKFDVQEKTPSKDEQEIKHEKPSETKVPATGKPSTKDQVNVKTEKTEASTAPNKSNSSHTEKTLVISKPVYKLPPKKDKNEDKENEVSYKRSSPVLKNRARSQTLPEQPVSKDILDTKTDHERSPKPIKKASSQEENSIRSKSPPSFTDQSPRRSSSVLIKPSSSISRPEIKKLTIVDKSNDNGGQPAWFAMAKRKTQAHRGDENGDNGNKNQKESENNAKKNEENKLTDSLEEIRASAAKRQSKVLDMVNKWQH